MKIGLMLPLSEDETNGFADLRAMAVAAEEGGLDSVWGADHLIFREGGETTGIHECWTVLTALAAITSRVQIGPLVLALPFRNPALTAKMAAELDEVSGGRLILGLGCGWHRPEFDAFGYPVRPSRVALRRRAPDPGPAAARGPRDVQRPVPPRRGCRAPTAPDPRRAVRRS